MKTRPARLPKSIYIVLVAAFLANVIATYGIIRFSL
jgi:hypothetical protein